jgi:hypothetical protein
VAAGDVTAAAAAAQAHIRDAVRFFERRHRGLLDEPLRPTLLLDSPTRAGGRRP